MELTRENDLGKIEVVDITFAGLLRDAIKRNSGKIFLASFEGKELGGFDRKVTLNEAAKNMSLVVDHEECFIEWEFYTIIAFGESISEVTNSVFNYLEKNLKASFPGYTGHIVLKIRGVKARQIAYRALMFERNF